MHIKIRKYGKKPYSAALIHGGPGAAGEMRAVAQHLSGRHNILEPIQNAASVENQIEELRETIERYASIPVTLAGYSWGAWLIIMVAARFPAMIQKLILISSAPFEEKYVHRLHETRLARLNHHDRVLFHSILSDLDTNKYTNKELLLSTLGELSSKADSFDAVEYQPEEKQGLTFRGDIYQHVWQEASAMRKNGSLLKIASQIKCPVVAIHGDHDPHPADGVQIPLTAVIQDFRFILMKHCGHKPWIERQARDDFFQILSTELEPQTR